MKNVATFAVETTAKFTKIDDGNGKTTPKNENFGRMKKNSPAARVARP